MNQKSNSLTLIGLAMIAGVAISFLCLIRSCDAVTPDVQAMTKNMDTVDQIQFHRNMARSYEQMMMEAVRDGSTSRIAKYQKLKDEQTAIADSLEWDRFTRIADTVAKESGSQPIQFRSGATDRMEPVQVGAYVREDYKVNGYKIPAGHYKSIDIDGKGAPLVTRMDGTTFRANRIHAKEVETITIGSKNDTP